MRPIRILVIEDEAIVGQDVQQALMSLGYDVPAVVASGEAALAAIPELRPDVVVADIQLGGFMDGIEASRRIHDRFGTPIIFLTGSGDTETVNRARSANPFVYLIKPYKPLELQSAIEGAVKAHRDASTLRHEHTQTLDALRSLSDAVIATDLAGTISFINPVAEQLTGWTSAEATGRMLAEIFVIYDAETGQQVDPLPISEDTDGSSSSDLGRSVMLRVRSGASVLVRDRTAAIRDRGGSLTGLLVAFRVQEPAEKEMIENAGSAFPDYLLAIVESISDPLYAIDSDGRINYANVSAGELLGRAREEMLGQRFWDQFPPATAAKLRAAIEQASLRDAGDTALEFLHEARGSWFDARIYSFREGVIVLLRDITGRKLANEQRGRMDKLESLGLLARGFAHDFNNLLTVILGHLSLARTRMPEEADYREDINTALGASTRAQGLVQQLLTFARGGSPIRRVVDFAAVLKDIHSDHQKERGIQYDLDLEDGLPKVSVDPEQIRRLVGNLMLNAEQALTSGGRIAMRAFTIPATEVPLGRLPGAGELDTESIVVVEIADDGEGIAADKLSKIFDPFFTTRQGANATGIGLTVCESIAKSHGGYMEIVQAEEGGTRASVFLPVEVDDREFTDAEPPVAATTEKKVPLKPRILVLDDEAPIRNLVRIQLERNGMEVVETAEGGETIDAYKRALETNQPFDVLIIDLSIPNGMGGVRAMEGLVEIDPEVNAIVSSGYSDDPVMSNYADYGFNAVLPKPYEPKQLQDLVEELIGRTPVS